MLNVLQLLSEASSKDFCDHPAKKGDSCNNYFPKASDLQQDEVLNQKVMKMDGLVNSSSPDGKFSVAENMAPMNDLSVKIPFEDQVSKKNDSDGKHCST